MITIRIGRKKLRIDPIETIGVLQRIEATVGVKNHKPTIALLNAIAEWLKLRGVDRPTPTQAWSVWYLVWAYVDQVGKREQANADIAHWYGINPFRLKDSQRLALWANLGRVQSQQQLIQGRFDPTDHKAVYNLVLNATGDETAANKARVEAMERYLESVLK